MTSIGSILLLLPAIVLTANLEKRYLGDKPEVRDGSGKIVSLVSDDLVNERDDTKQALGSCTAKLATPDVLSCHQIRITADFCCNDNNNNFNFGNTTYTFERRIPPHSCSYSSDVGSALLTPNCNSGTCRYSATLTTGDQIYTIEPCNTPAPPHCHTLSQLNETDKGDIVIQSPSQMDEMPISDRADVDNTTVATYYIYFYYTPQFAATTPDIDGFIDKVLAATNLGYANSNVPLVAKRHCAEQATINDERDAGKVLTKFTSMKGTTAALRGTADVAALLVNSFGSCGIAWGNTIRNGDTISATDKGCAEREFTVGHEIGHNMGLHHNPEANGGTTNNAYPHGRGHLIDAGSTSESLRTILAYRAPGHYKRVNYYSNPNLIHPKTGTPTGVEGVSNNAAVLLRNRFRLASVGDESVACGSSGGVCVNDDSTGDVDNDTCTEYYDKNPGGCGKYDTATFTASIQCCACGGGITGTTSICPHEDEIDATICQVYKEDGDCTDAKWAKWMANYCAKTCKC